MTPSFSPATSTGTQLPTVPNVALPQAQQIVGRDAVSTPVLSDIQREAAIELAELREAWFEHEGLHTLAEHMREQQAQLIAGRTKGART